MLLLTKASAQLSISRRKLLAISRLKTDVYFFLLSVGRSNLIREWETRTTTLHSFSFKSLVSNVILSFKKLATGCYVKLNNNELALFFSLIASGYLGNVSIYVGLHEVFGDEFTFWVFVPKEYSDRRFY